MAVVSDRLHRDAPHQVRGDRPLCLGLGFYSYIASWVMMPIYLALSLIVVWRAGGPWVRPMAAAAAGFSLPVLLFLPWLWFHPAMLRETFDRYQMSDQEQMLDDPGTGNAFRRDKVAATLTRLLEPFRSGLLFLTGGPSMTTSTGRVGVFLLPLAVLLPLGAYRSFAQARSPRLQRPDPARHRHRPDRCHAQGSAVFDSADLVHAAVCRARRGSWPQ